MTDEQYNDLKIRTIQETQNTRTRDWIRHLFEIANNDPTVKTYLDSWMSGLFPSLEIMLVRLALQLQSEKQEYFKSATKVFQSSPIPPITIQKDNPENSI